MEITTGTALGPSYASLQVIAVSGQVDIQVMVGLCQLVQGGLEMPNEWGLSIVVTIFKMKSNIKNWSFYGA